MCESSEWGYWSSLRDEERRSDEERRTSDVRDEPDVPEREVDVDPEPERELVNV